MEIMIQRVLAETNAYPDMSRAHIGVSGGRDSPSLGAANGADALQAVLAGERGAAPTAHTERLAVEHRGSLRVGGDRSEDGVAVLTVADGVQVVAGLSTHE